MMRPRHLPPPPRGRWSVPDLSKAAGLGGAQGVAGEDAGGSGLNTHGAGRITIVGEEAGGGAAAGTGGIAGGAGAAATAAGQRRPGTRPWTRSSSSSDISNKTIINIKKDDKAEKR